MELAHAAPLAIALLGLVLGMRHATDADHVIAVSTIVTRERRLGVAARIGLCWGAGHTLTIILVGAAIIVFNVSIPPRIGLAMEFAVAVVLILLGVSALTGLLSRVMARVFGRKPASSPKLIVHTHQHAHGSAHAHRHPHVHVVGATDGEAFQPDPPHQHPDHRLPPETLPMMARLGTRFPQAKAFGVGLVHGLAGSAAIALLVLSAIPNPLWGVLYLGVFGLGTILGMILITTAIGIPLMVAAERAAGFNRALALGSGLLSFGFGAFLAYRIGIVDGLLRGAPIWIPH
jgi:ABC-type nickel/cobalt efflux system permease component RcnA